MQLKITFFLHAASGGGAERAVITVANRLAAMGETVDLVLARKEGPFLGEISSDVRLVDLAAGSIRKSLFPMSRYMREARPDVLVSALVGTDVISLLGKLVLRWPVHLHLTVQNTPSATAKVAPDRLERNWPAIIRLLYRFADSITGISIGVADDVTALLGRRSGAIPVINNPVDIDTVHRRMRETPAHPWLADKSAPTLLAVGRLVNQKDFPTLLQAFAALRRTTDARLVILGEGPDRAQLEAQVKSLDLQQSVALPGFDGNPFSAMHAADLFVLSSRWEGFANVVAESLACGTPVVSTDCPSGPAEILAGGDYGKLVPVGDVDALTSAMRQALAEPRQSERLMERANAFSSVAIANQYLTLFNGRNAR